MAVCRDPARWMPQGVGARFRTGSQIEGTGGIRVVLVGVSAVRLCVVTVISFAVRMIDSGGMEMSAHGNSEDPVCGN
jgi:hypothetical protein